MQGLTLEQLQQVHHIARLAVLALCARGVAADEFDTNPEIESVRITVHRPGGAEVAGVDVEYVGNHQIPLGGMSL